MLSKDELEARDPCVTHGVTLNSERVIYRIFNISIINYQDVDRSSAQGRATALPSLLISQFHVLLYRFTCFVVFL